MGKLTEEQIEQIPILYCEKKRSMPEIADIFKVRCSTIYMNEVISFYRKGWSCSKIGKRYGVSYNWITDKLKKKGILIREGGSYSNRKYQLQEDVFKKINSKNKAWLFGWILADGSIGKYKMTISVKQEDYRVLEKFKKILKTNTPLRKDKKKDLAYLQINSKKLVNDLKDNGVVECKKRNELNGIPVFNNDLEKHFIRGLFEGDGSIGIYKKGLYVHFTSSSLKLMNRMKDFGYKYTGSKSNIWKSPNGHYYRYFLAWQKAIRFSNAIYSDCGNNYLPRKREIYEKFKNSEKGRRFS